MGLTRRDCGGLVKSGNGAAVGKHSKGKGAASGAASDAASDAASERDWVRLGNFRIQMIDYE